MECDADGRWWPVASCQLPDAPGAQSPNTHMGPLFPYTLSVKSTAHCLTQPDCFISPAPLLKHHRGHPRWYYFYSCLATAPVGQGDRPLHITLSNCSAVPLRANSAVNTASLLHHNRRDRVTQLPLLLPVLLLAAD
jgi:hypothetical protein